MFPTKLVRSWLLSTMITLVTVCLPALAQPNDHRYTFGALPLSEAEYQSYLKVKPGGARQAVQARLPAAYNAADLGFVTPAKDQGKCSACWAFASAGAMESKLLMSGVRASGSPLDVSEQQQISCNTKQSGCKGGFLTAPLFWAPPPDADSGPLPESVFPYAASNTSCFNPSGSQIQYRVKDFYTVPVSINEFKASLYADGPGLFNYVIREDFQAFWDSSAPNSVYKYDEIGFIEGLHMVLLIGWDDAKQAFLLKNSLGQYAGPNGNGTFWMSYADIELLNFKMANFRIAVAVPGGTTPESIDVDLVSGWNLLGNGYESSFDVASVFADSTKITSVWKWLPAKRTWGVYAPALSAQEMLDYTLSKGYDMLSSIQAGEGYWVNSRKAHTVSLPAAVPIASSSFNAEGSRPLGQGWNLVATGDAPTPRAFNTSLSISPPSPGALPVNLHALWSWDTKTPGWYFWAPGLVNAGTLQRYITSKEYLDFSTLPGNPAGTLSPHTGVWVNRP